MSKPAIVLSGTARLLLDEFENAVREHAFKGAKSPESKDGIVAEYENAKRQLEILIGSKERTIRRLKDELKRGTASTPPPVNKCCVCDSTENLHKDGWYGYRCNKPECMVL